MAEMGATEGPWSLVGEVQKRRLKSCTEQCRYELCGAKVWRYFGHRKRPVDVQESALVILLRPKLAFFSTLTMGTCTVSSV